MSLAKHLSCGFLAANLVLFACPTSRAAEPVPFNAPAFRASQKEGKPILVEITASWCPTCAKQRPVLSQLLAEPRFQNLVVYQVDFDTQKDVVRAMRAYMQSTLIVFTGTTEKGRSTGVTDAAAIQDLLARTNG